MSTPTRFLALLIAALLCGSGVQPALADESPAESAPTQDAGSERLDLVDRFEGVIKCVTLDDEFFCTELGFLATAPGRKAWDAKLEQAVAADVSGTGDMSYVDLVVYLESLSEKDLAARQEAQIADASRAVGRIKLIDLLDQNRSIPEGFFERYSSLGISEKGAMAEGLRAAATDKSGKSLLEHLRDSGALDGVVLDAYGEDAIAGGSAKSTPSSRYIIYEYYVEQSRDYYCGPATMDAIDWSDDGWQNGQEFWAGPNYLNTDAQGATALSDLVSGTNSWTNWDSVGGSYSIASVEDKSQSWFVTLHKIRIGAWGGPDIEHVKLRNEYFTYLRYDHGGHFQTGRGYSDSTGKIAIFEPYDERDWRSGGYATGKRQYVLYENIFDATQAHPHQNFGV